MTYVLDSNVIIYAFDPTDASKHRRARTLMAHAMATSRLFPRQVLGEILSVAHRRRHLPLARVRELVDEIEALETVLPTDASALQLASVLAERYGLQFFDALILEIVRSAGQTILLTEDMHDGLRLGSLTIVDPFKASNDDLVTSLIG